MFVMQPLRQDTSSARGSQGRLTLEGLDGVMSLEGMWLLQTE